MSDSRPPAPWPLEGAEGLAPQGCRLCAGLRAPSEEPGWIVHRGRRCFVALHPWPFNSGHLDVAPYAHVDSLAALDEPTLLELVTLSRTAIRLLRREHAPEGFNLGLDDGTVPGGPADPHLSLQVIPRWAADTGFIAAVGHARVVPQSLADSYAELRAAFSWASAGQSEA